MARDMSNTENQIETLTALKRDVREVINEWKAEKSAIEAQRNELFTSLQRKVDNEELQEEFNTKKDDLAALSRKQQEVFEKILEEAKNLVDDINKIMPGVLTVKLAKGFQKKKTRYGPDDDEVGS